MPERHGCQAARVTVTLVVMGPSGTGKTSVAQALGAATGWVVQEGDDLHPEANRAKMAAGHPLDDADRWPWLRRVAEWIGEQEAAGQDAVVTCSALKSSYRDLLRDGHPSVRFVALLVPRATLEARLTARKGHFMPASLLDSQLATFEMLGPGERGIVVAASSTPDEIARETLEHLEEG